MYFNTMNYSIYYEKYGIGEKNILILPGWGETRETFYNIINCFKKDYTIYIVDYPGFGNSVFPDKDLTIYDYSNIIRDFMEEERISDPIIIAHSFGGRIACLLNGYYKEKISKMILIDVAGIKRRKSFKVYFKEKLYKLLKKLKRFVRNKTKYQEKLFKIFGSSDYKNLNNNMKKTFRNVISEDLSYYYKYMDSEVLIIWGKLDKDTPLRDGQKINRLIKNSALIVYPTGSHFSYLEFPILTNKIIDSFIEK